MRSRLRSVVWCVALVGCRTATPPTPTPDEAPLPAVADEIVDTSGMGAVHFGMDRAGLERAIGAPIEASGEGCELVSPTGDPAFTWMLDGGVLVRIDVVDPAIVADGGGRVGMSAEDLRARYAGRIVEEPNKYDPKGATWVVGQPDAAHFVFELDETARVVVWRAGLVPQVDWVERCG